METRILVFDEDPLILEAFAKFLRKENYQMIGACNLEEAQRQLQAEPVQLIILNVNLKNPVWQPFLEYCNENFPWTPILGITAFPEILYQNTSMLKGIEKICVKPFEIEELRQKIKALLSESREGQAKDNGAKG